MVGGVYDHVMNELGEEGGAACNGMDGGELHEEAT